MSPRVSTPAIAVCLHLIRVTLPVGVEALTFRMASPRSGTAEAAKNLFIRKQFALYYKPQGNPRRVRDASRAAMIVRAVPHEKESITTQWEAMRIA
jgi:hypothetical protein